MLKRRQATKTSSHYGITIVQGAILTVWFLVMQYLYTLLTTVKENKKREKKLKTIYASNLVILYNKVIIITPLYSVAIS